MSIRKPFQDDSYAGRVLHFFALINPVNLLCSERDIRESQKLLQDAMNGKKIGDAEYKKAYYNVLSNLHPDTQKPIFLPFRLSAFVPMNIPIVFGLCLKSPITIRQSCFFQFVNQSYNFGVNVCNANATNAFDSIKECFPNYIIAVGSSLMVTVGLLAILLKGRFAKYEHIVRLAPYSGAVAAELTNVVGARYRDYTRGLILRDAETGEIFQDLRSREAGKISLRQGAISKMCIPFPVFFFPPFARWILKQFKMTPSGRYQKVVVDTMLVGAGLWLALPLSIGLFPQDIKIHYSKLEPEFHSLKNSRGQSVEYFKCNRGL